MCRRGHSIGFIARISIKLGVYIYAREGVAANDQGFRYITTVLLFDCLSVWRAVEPLYHQNITKIIFLTRHTYNWIKALLANNNNMSTANFDSCVTMVTCRDDITTTWNSLLYNPTPLAQSASKAVIIIIILEEGEGGGMASHNPIGRGLILSIRKSDNELIEFGRCFGRLPIVINARAVVLSHFPVMVVCCVAQWSPRTEQHTTTLTTDACLSLL